MSFILDLPHIVSDFMSHKRDPRVDGWLLMSSPIPTVVLVGLYVYFVKSLGPRLMKDRQPFQLGLVVTAFNALQVVASLVLLYKFMVHGWLFRYSWSCQPVDYSNDADELAVAETCWWFFICKLVAMIDTDFLVLQKNVDQITDIHVANGALMPLMAWAAVRFVPGGHATLFATVNTFVHYQKFTWWKQHQATLQIVQWVLVLIHSGRLLLSDQPCPEVPKAVAYVLCAYCLFFLVLAYLQNESDTKAGKPNSLPLGWLGKVGSFFREFMIKLTSACAMDQSALYESYDQPSGHVDDSDNASGGSSSKKDL